MSGVKLGDIEAATYDQSVADTAAIPAPAVPTAKPKEKTKPVPLPDPSEPSNVAERALIGALLQDGAAYPVAVSAGVVDESFTDAGCRDAWVAVRRLHENGKPVDPLTVSELMRGDQGENLLTLGEWMDDCPTAVNAGSYAAQVAVAHRRERLRTAARLAVETLGRGGDVSVVAEQLKAAGEAVGAATDESVPRPYAVRSWGEIARMHLPPPEIVWGGCALGGSWAFFGIGGLGKSRLALNVARNQVLGLPFAGLPTAPRPLRHMMMGSENSIHRLQYDIRKMNGELTAEEVAKLEHHIQLATLEGEEDTDISLTPANVERWRLTLEGWPPDVLWADPWGDLLDGDANSDDVARAAISVLRRLLRRVNKDAGLGILAHSRTGANNIAQAVGYDAANFGKGSKALYSKSRCVWNIAPGDESESPPLVMVHAKHNDTPGEKPFAVRLDPDTMTYHRDDGFDLEQWQADLSARARGKRGPKKGPAMTEEQAVEALGDKVGTTAEVIQILRDKGATKDNATDLVKRLVLAGTWEQWHAPVKNGATYVGPPDALKKKRAEVADKLQKKLKVG